MTLRRYPLRSDIKSRKVLRDAIRIVGLLHQATFSEAAQHQLHASYRYSQTEFLLKQTGQFTVRDGIRFVFGDKRNSKVF